MMCCLEGLDVYPKQHTSNFDTNDPVKLRCDGSVVNEVTYSTKLMVDV